MHVTASDNQQMSEWGNSLNFWRGHFACASNTSRVLQLLVSHPDLGRLAAGPKLSVDSCLNGKDMTLFVPGHISVRKMQNNICRCSGFL